ncbi:MAG TPA: glycosyltransferase family 4 protein, partial [Verrucomicrobiae bacterium]|nr:glycosyltransferase family 4 protein [Verrucomicrobiae bacterium]
MTRDLMAGLIALDMDVRLLTFDDSIPRDLPDWLTERLVIVPRLGFWMTFDETRDAETQMREMIAPKFTPEGYADGWAPDCLLVVGDPASVDRFGLVDMLPDGLPAFHYVPVEGSGLPPAWGLIWQRIKPIAMSKFGAQEIEQLTGKPVPMVYHGVDTSVFHPVDRDHPIVWPETTVTSRKEAKEAFGIDPKTTLILRTDANMPRKAYGALFRSVAPVLTKHPDSLLFVHASLTGEGGDLRVFRSHFHPSVASRIALPGFHEKYGGIPRYALATLYNAADVYVSNSCEGFGLTIAEAIACGVPAVGLDWSAVPEVIGPAGLTVPVGRYIENIYAHWWGVADERQFAAA